MRIDKIDLRGYGLLRSRIFELGPQINVIVGRNEAGKSTLLRAIDVLLYGHFKDTAAWDGAATLFQFEPWSGGQYGGTIYLALASGDTYRIERRFDTERTTVYRDPGADDVTGQYNPGSHGWVSFVDRHLGLSPAVFRASACIREGDVALGVRGVAALRGRLEQLSDSGGAEQSVQDALDGIERHLQQDVNPRGILLERSPFLRVQQAIRDFSAQLEVNRTALDDIARLVLEGRRFGEVVAGIERQQYELEGVAASRIAKEFDDKLERLDAIGVSIQAASLDVAALSEVGEITEATLAAADAGIGDLTRLRGDIARLDERVVAEQSLSDTAVQEQASLSQELAQQSTTVDASEADLSVAERAVEAWALSEVGLRDTEESLVALQRRRAEFEAQLDPRLSKISATTTVDPRSALSNAVSRHADLVAAEAEVVTTPIDDVAESELSIIEKKLGGLTAEGLEELRAAEANLRTVESTTVKPPSDNYLLPLVGLVAGLAIGYVTTQSPLGAVLAGIVGGLVGYLLMYRLRPKIDATADTTRSQLFEKLAGYGVSSVDDLQRRWNRRAELRESLNASQQEASRHSAAKSAADRSLDDLEAATGTRDLDQAAEIVGLFEAARESDRTFDGRERQVAESVELARTTQSQARSAAQTAVARLNLHVPDPAAGRALLSELRSERVKKSATLGRQSDVARALDGFRRTISDRDAYRSALVVAEEKVQGDLIALGIAGDAATWEAQLAAKRERLARHRELTQYLEIQLQRRAELLGNEDGDAWRAKAAALRARAVEPLPGDQRTLDDLRAEIARLDEQLRDAHAELVRVTTLRAERSRDLEHPAEVDERRSAAIAELERLEYLASVLTETSSRIDIVAKEYRRGFAPRLADGVSEWIERATLGRYLSADVSPADLSVRLASRERGGLVPLEIVSQGTREAVALLLRVSIVDLLSNADEPVPLFLDDPLVHVDPERTSRILEVLTEISRTRQLFYFTQEPRIVDWASGRPDCVVHLMESATEAAQP